MKKKLTAFGLIAGIVLGAWVLIAPSGSGPLAAAGARLQLAGFTDTEYDLSELRYFYAAAAKVNGEYVDPTRVEPQEMLTSSLDHVARKIPEFLYTLDEEARLLTVLVGTDTTEFALPEMESIVELSGVVKEVAGFLDDHLDETIERPPIEYALMNGMLKTLDPHSVYIEPEYYKEMSIQNKGHFGGLGITIGIRDNRLTILYPLKDTPAWRAGLEAGDRIDKIGSESTVNMTLQEAVGKLRGEEGTEVTITVSNDDDPIREVTITRARIEVPSVEWAYAGDGVGLIEMSHFAQQTYDRLEEALEELETEAIQDHQGKLKGVVIDLRGNPGGYLQQAIEVADKFLAGGTIVATEGLAGSARDVTPARKFGTEDELPIVVLVDESSASASEIVAGALQQHDRALVVGVRTFGKGSVQNLYDRDFHEGALKLTIAQYLTGGDQSIQGVGIIPDIELRRAVVKNEDGDRRVQLFWQDFELREEDLEHAFVWGATERENEIPQWVYSCADCFEDTDDTRETGPDVGNVEVQAAKALLIAQPASSASSMLQAAPDALDDFFSERSSRLEGDLLDLGIEWTAGPKAPKRVRKGMPSTTPATVSLKVSSDSGLLTPGVAAEVSLTVTNTSKQTLHRLRAVTEGKFFHGREFFFGKVEPGETKSFAVDAKPHMWLHSRTEEVTWHFFAEGAPAPAPFVSKLQIEEVAHPRFAFSWHVIDDGSGGSRGNGDGLLQAGEEIDLLVTVKNIGSGSTSDLWRAATGAADEADEGKQYGFVQLRNRSAESLFLTEGTGAFSLQPGEVSVHRLHFRVTDDTSGLESVKAELLVGDEKFLELVSTDLEIPLFSPSDPIAAVDRRMKPKFGKVKLRGGASEHAPVVATLSGPADIDGRLGQWFRTSLPWGGSGWIPANELVQANRNEAPVAEERFLSNSPPVVSLASNPGGSIVTGESLLIDGKVLDDDEVKDLFVFVNDKKVSYKRVEGKSVEHAFSLEVDLGPGENQIEIFARDTQGHLGSLSLGVYRESATASAPAVEGDAVIR